MQDALILALIGNKPNNLTSDFRLFKSKSTGLILRYPASYYIFDDLDYYPYEPKPEPVVPGTQGYGSAGYGEGPYGG